MQDQQEGFFNDEQPQQPTVAQSDAVISWTASEFIEHPKTAMWYVICGFGSAIVIAVIYLVTRDVFSIISLSLLVVVFMIFAARKPRTLQYQLNSKGIQAGERFYSLGQFKSFSVIDEGAIHSIAFTPLKRFMPVFTIYFSPEDENKIVDFLSAHLPYQERQQDPVDRLMRSIRF
jgi:hypothetical protein